MSTIAASPLNTSGILGSNLALEPLAAFFGPVGDSRSFSVESVWSTAVSQAFSSAEQRQQLRGRPYRRFDLRAYAFSRNESVVLQAQLAKMAQRRFLAPLFCDESPVTGSLSAAATTITCTTDYRRFFPGGRVVVYRRAYAGQWPAFEVATIASVGGSSLTLEDGLAGSYAAPVYVAPLLECELSPTHDGEYAFLYQLAVSLQATERIGPMTAPAIQAANTVPGSWYSAGGLPIFDPLLWMTKTGRAGYLRDGDIASLGLGSYPDVRGARARGTYSIGVECLTRAEAWSFLKFCESRAGRAWPFWVFSPSETFTLDDGIIEEDIRVEALGDIGDWEYRPYLGLSHTDGSYTILDLENVVITRGGGIDTITFEDALETPIDPDDVERVCLVRKMRFAEDVVSEEWTKTLTDYLFRSSVNAVEVLEEKSITIVMPPVDPPEGPDCDEGCVAGLTAAYIAGLPSTVELDITEDDIDPVPTAEDAPGGTEQWDGSFIKSYDQSTGRLYVLPLNDDGEAELEFDGKLLDYDSSGIFWVPPQQRDEAVGCWELRIYYQLEAVDTPPDNPPASQFLGVNLATRATYNREWDFTDVMKKAVFKNDAWRCFVDARGRYPQVGTTGTRGYTVVNGGPGTVTVTHTNGIVITGTNDVDWDQVAVYMPGYGPGEANDGDVTHTTFRSKYGIFSLFRAMDWLATNHSPIVTWADRSMHPVSIEDICAVHNECEADLWFCVPHLANNDYINNAAALLLSELDSSRTLYLEWSNELWNTPFGQSRYIRNGNPSGDIDHDLWAARAGNTFSRFASVWSGSMSRLKRIVAGQAPNEWHAKRVAERIGAGNFDAISCASYIGNSLSSSLTGSDTPPSIITKLRATIAGHRSGWQRHGDLARSYGVPLLGYEGGQHIVPRSQKPWYDAWYRAQTTPAMKTAYTEMLEAWESAGGSLFCHFNGTEKWSVFGAWGMLQHMDETNADAPKYDALYDWI